MLLQDKVVIITGGANGIGSVYCSNLALEGARLIIADVDLEHGKSLAAYINQGAESERALALQVDVTSEEETRGMAMRALEQFGRIDVLVNNAGVYPHLDFEHINYAEWRRVLTVNLDSVFLCAKAVLPQMKAQGSGKIINIATNLVWVGLAGMVHYVASKAGVVGFTRSLARELGEHGITVNALAPGAVIPDATFDPASEIRVNEIVGHQCIKRRQQPGDLVGPLIFLCSDDSDFISGQVLSVDGGLTNH